MTYSCAFSLSTLFPKERRRAEIEVKLEEKRELERETAVQERNTLFQELKTKKTKIAQINNQMAAIKNVRFLL